MSIPGTGNRRGEWAGPWVVFAACLGILWYHAAPGVTFHDSGEFALAATAAGIPHAPGAPSWTAAAAAFCRLAPVHDAARATNLFSGFCGAVTLALLYSLTSSAVRTTFPDSKPWSVRAAALCSVLACLSPSAFIELSLSTEQYTLLTAVLIAVLLVGHSLLTASGMDCVPWRRCILLGILWGLALGNHPSQLALVFPILVIVWYAGTNSGSPIRALAILTACVFIGFVSGLVVFLWIPLRSAAHPLLDHANIENFSGLIGFLSRSDWSTRPISETPPGFVREWVATYAPIQQLGWLAVLLAVLGFAATIRHDRRWFFILIAIAVPYAGGMLVSHMKQANIDINYIRHYGITDWHVPLYVLGSFAAGIGVARLMSFANTTPRRARLIAAACIAVLALSAFRTIHEHSLRGYQGAQRFVSALLDSLPENSVILSQTDNVSYMLGYEILAGSFSKDRWIGQDRIRFNEEIGGAGWSREFLVNGIRNRVADGNVQPFKQALPDAGELMDRPVYVEYDPTFPRSAEFLVPAGFLFQVMDAPVPGEEVLRSLQRSEGAAATPPEPRPDLHRWEQEAWALLYQRRAGYLADRQLWEHAEAAYSTSLQYQARNGIIWYCLADAQEKNGKRQEAAESYRSAIDSAPNLEGPRSNLAILFAESGDFETAEALLVEELKINPQYESARENLRRVRAQMDRPGAK